jgi:hypothetical protein
MGAFDTAVLADSPLSYWRMDATEGSTETDVAGGFNGTYSATFALNQPSLIPVESGGSVRLNSSGTSGKLKASRGSGKVDTEWAYEIWVSFASIAAAESTVLHTASVNTFSHMMRVLSNGKINANFGNGTEWLKLNAEAPEGTIQAGPTYLIAVKATTSGWKIFVNGVVKAEGAWTSKVPLLWDSTRPVVIGNNEVGTAVLNGYVDAVAIFGAISDERLAAHYAAAFPKPSVFPPRGRVAVRGLTIR